MCVECRDEALYQRSRREQGWAKVRLVTLLLEATEVQANDALENCRYVDAISVVLSAAVADGHLITDVAIDALASRAGDMPTRRGSPIPIAVVAAASAAWLRTDPECLEDSEAPPGFDRRSYGDATRALLTAAKDVGHDGPRLLNQAIDQHYRFLAERDLDVVHAARASSLADIVDIRSAASHSPDR